MVTYTESQKKEGIAKIQRLLAAKLDGMAWTELKEATGLKYQTLNRYLKELVDQGTIRKEGQRKQIRYKIRWSSSVMKEELSKHMIERRKQLMALRRFLHGSDTLTEQDLITLYEAETGKKLAYVSLTDLAEFLKAIYLKFITAERPLNVKFKVTIENLNFIIEDEINKIDSYQKTQKRSKK